MARVRMKAEKASQMARRVECNLELERLRTAYALSRDQLLDYTQWQRGVWANKTIGEVYRLAAEREAQRSTWKDKT